MPDVGAGFRTALIHHLADLHYVWLHGPGCGQPGYRSLTRLDCAVSPFTPPIGAFAEKAARLTGDMACHTVRLKAHKWRLSSKQKLCYSRVYLHSSRSQCWIENAGMRLRRQHASCGLLSTCRVLFWLCASGMGTKAPLWLPVVLCVFLVGLGGDKHMCYGCVCVVGVGR